MTELTSLWWHEAAVMVAACAANTELNTKNAERRGIIPLFLKVFLSSEVSIFKGIK